jgi:PHP family Zn ribbon phosphoesterase
MEYERIISEMGNEYHILLDEKIDRIKEKAGENIGEIIKAQREDNLSIKPGFDGEYGKIIDY